MPAVSEKQRKATHAAAAGRSTLGIPKKVGEEFVGKDAEGGHAAGLVLVAPDGDILLLRRGRGEENYAGHWALPGGKAEDGEDPQTCAMREAAEEMGKLPDLGKPKLLDKRSTPNGMIFHTLAAPTEVKFAPTLNGEHSGYGWFGPDELPRPMHPAVRATLDTQLGMGLAEDLDPEQWEELRSNFAQWTREEEQEPEHATDELPAGFTPARAAERLAFDRSLSQRTIDADGRLHVVGSAISKACVNEYLGSEIPDYQEQGLDPKKLYRLWRHPDELKKGAETFSRLPILDEHIPVDAADHKHKRTIGATGSDVRYEHPYLKNSLAFWTQDAIDDIESEEKKELSSAYRYRADMTPGVTPEGELYDGVMRDIVGNHVALVKQGRAGPDVVVGDSMETVNMAKAAAVKMTNKGRSVFAIVRHHLSPILAKDEKLPDLRGVLAKLSTKNFAEIKPKLTVELKKLKLAKDAKLDGVMKLVEALEENEVPNSDVETDVPQLDPNAGTLSAGTETMDAENGGLPDFLKGKLSEDDYNTACGMLKGPKGEDEEKDDKDDEDKEDTTDDADPDKDDDAAEKDKDKAKDKDPPMSKKAMDAAIKANVEAAVKKERTNARAVRDAEEAVRPYVGKIAIAQDSALGVFQTALEMLGVKDAKEIDSVVACKAVLNVQRKAGEKDHGHHGPTIVPIAMDADHRKSLDERFPGMKRIQIG